MHICMQVVLISVKRRRISVPYYTIRCILSVSSQCCVDEEKQKYMARRRFRHGCHDRLWQDYVKTQKRIQT